MKLLILFCIIWCVVQARVNPKADEHPAEKDWWATTVFYQVYPISFKDSNGDGNGDIKGITSKLDHIKDSGIGAIWLSPIFESPKVDMGYDISNFRLVDPIFGTNEDLYDLFKKAKAKGIKVILDFVPNHTSDKHEWFKRSEKNEPQYRDYYIWKDPKTYNGSIPVPPNNWVSIFSGSAWEWHEGRQQFYFHQFDKAQPDLNYRNPAVAKEMKDILTFWLEKGADGFRVDAINHLYEDKDFKDEPVTGTDPNDVGYTQKIYTKDQNETYDMVFQWRDLLTNYQITNKSESKILLTEAYANITFTHRFYGTSSSEGAQIPFNFLFIEGLHTKMNASDISDMIDTWLDSMPKNREANWVLGNHDTSRIGSKTSEPLIPVLNTLVMTLPGIAVTYNGEEIGMLDNRKITWEQTKDPQAINKNDSINYLDYSRDPARTPFQWDSTTNAGFSSASAAKLWLPVNENYKTINLEDQKKAEKSIYKHYQALVKLRKEMIFTHGGYEQTTYLNKVLAYKRVLANHETYTVLLNFDESEKTIDIKKFTGYDDNVVVLLSTPASKTKIGDELETQKIVLKGFDGIIIKNKKNAAGAVTISLLLFISVVLRNLL